MSLIRKETKQNLLNQINKRNAEFVTTGSRKSDRFKYILGLSFNKYISNGIISINNTWKKITGRPKLWIKDVDFIAMRNDSAMWLAEVTLEGALTYFAIWALVESDSHFVKMLGCGVAVKQILSIYWRLRKNGATTTIPAKN